MSDAPRDLRDRLGEALWRADLRGLFNSARWVDATDKGREAWLSRADAVIASARSCGLKIVPDDGDAPMTMLERAARALADEGDWPSEQEWLTELALATIRAIRVPDERVLEAMISRFDCAYRGRPTHCPAGDGCECRKDALAVWQAGIDAMMEDGK